jgi:pyruvate formate lyase activating enzyme
MTKAVCGVCPHKCGLSEGRTGLCRARICSGGNVVSLNYGKITSIALDPIEKKPFARFMPGSYILSAGSFGCNLRCPYCQNYEISMCGENDAYYRYISPKNLAARAKELVSDGNIGLAYTYNEPLISVEYIVDCAKLIKDYGLVNAIVTNGYATEETLLKVLPYADAMNIDLKGFSEEFYRNVGGDLETVKNSINLCYGKCHLEVTTLIIPGENDGEEEMENLSAYLAGVGQIPLHITRYYPRYKYTKKPASAGKLQSLARIAGKHLKYVYCHA